MTIEGFLQLHAQENPSKVAVICGEERVTYAELWQRIKSRTQELKFLGVGPGTPYLFRNAQDISFLETYFGVHLLGGIAVPLERDLPSSRLEDISLLVKHSILPEGVADILFTTGTTGKSKGVMITYQTILAEAENLIDAQGYTSEQTFVITGPLNHIGSLSKIYPVLLLGGTLHILESMKNLDAFYSALDSSSHLATFLVPANIRTLLQFSKERLATYKEQIEFIETGAAPMSLSDMQELCSILPKTRLFNTYASTETGIIATYNYNAGKCISACLGKPMKHSTLYITEEGRIVCGGKTLMKGYVGDEKLTEQILKDGKLYTSDLGFLDEEGQLHLEGRMDDVINIGGYKISPVEVEEIALSMPEIKDCICIYAIHPIVKEPVLKLLVVLQPDIPFEKRKIALFLKDRLEKYKLPVLYEAVSAIQRTYNGKLDRKYYH